MQLTVIGVIHSPHKSPDGAPIQPTYAAGAEGRVEVFTEWSPALADLDDIERLWLIYVFDRAADFRHRVIPYRDTRERGLFATRAPCRPNPIGMSVVTLLGRDANVLRVAGLDILDGTPLLDIKPYVPAFDAYPDSRAGWLDEQTEDRREADKRFHRPRGGPGLP